MQDKTVALLLHLEGGRIEVRLTQRTTDLEFLTDRESFLRSHNLQLPDTTTLSTLKRNEIGNGSEVIFQFAVDQLRELLLGVLHRPSVEIGRLLIEIIQHLRKDMLIARVTIGIVERLQIGLWRILPAILKLLSLSATTFREARVADLILIDQNLSARGLYGLFHSRTRLFGDALIALAMIIGTHVENGMVFTIVPAYEFIILFDKREEGSTAIFHLLALTHLGQEPRTGNDGMCLQEF